MKKIICRLIINSLRTLIALLFSVSLFPQNKSDFQIFDKHDGTFFKIVDSREPHPPFLSINAILQTRDGYLWLGTRNGLFRYDGIRFSTFNKLNTTELESDNISCLYEDRNNCLWLGSNKGLFYYKNKKINRFNLPETINSLSIVDIIEENDQSFLIAVSKGGIFRIQNNTITPVFQSSKIRLAVMSITNDGAIWFGTPDTGLFRFKDNVLKRFSTENGLTSNTIRALLKDSQNRFWVGTWGGGLLEYRDGIFKQFRDIPDLTDNVILDILEDKTGNIWIGTSGNGLVKYNSNGFITFSLKNGLSNDAIKALNEDKEGNLWIGSFDGELNMMNTSKIVTLTKKDGLSNNFIWTVYCDKENNIYIGTNGGGINVISNNNISAINTNSGLSNNLVRCIYKDKNRNLWAGTSGGLNIIKDKKTICHSEKNGFCNDLVKSIYEDWEGNIWVGTRTGMAVFKKGVLNKYTKIEELSKYDIRFITVDKNGDLLLGTNEGMIRYERGKITLYNESDGQSIGIVYSIYVDETGLIWIAAGKGLYVLKNEKLISLGEAGNNLKQVIYNIIEDDYRNLWMSSNFGILCINKSSLREYINDKSRRVDIIVYNKKDGMLTTECNGGNQPAGCKIKNGNILFPTMNGLAYINTILINYKKNRIAPQVLINNLIVDNQQIEIEGNEITLAAGSSRIEFNYCALSLSAPEKNQYRYMLEGYDNDFISVGNRTMAQYTNLTSGHYKFRVTACNNDEIWNNTGAELNFILKPYFFQTPIFYFLFALTLSGSAIALYFFRENQFKKRKKELELLINERTAQLQEANATKDKLFSIIAHDLKSPMTTLVLTLEMLSDDFDDLPEETLKDFIRESKDNSENIIYLLENLLRWAGTQRSKIEYKPDNNSLTKVIIENMQLLQQTAKNKQIKILFETENEIFAFFDRDMISTVIRNLISNSIKFSDPGEEISIKIAKEEHSFQISVSDKGKGITEENLHKLFKKNQHFTSKGTNGEKGTGLGLILCKELIEKNNGKIWVQSEPNKGSTFRFTLPDIKNQ